MSVVVARHLSELRGARRGQGSGRLESAPAASGGHGMPGASSIPVRDGVPLVERSEQLKALRKALAAATNGAGGRVVLVQGEAGIGKTTLLREFCRGAGNSVRVLWAGCEPLFTPRPLGPLHDLAAATSGQVAASVSECARSYDVA